MDGIERIEIVESEVQQEPPIVIAARAVADAEAEAAYGAASRTAYIAAEQRATARAALEVARSEMRKHVPGKKGHASKSVNAAGRVLAVLDRGPNRADNIASEIGEPLKVVNGALGKLIGLKRVLRRLDGTFSRRS
jgi:hypothetical protein